MPYNLWFCGYRVKKRWSLEQDSRETSVAKGATLGISFYSEGSRTHRHTGYGASGIKNIKNISDFVSTS